MNNIANFLRTVNANKEVFSTKSSNEQINQKIILDLADAVIEFDHDKLDRCLRRCPALYGDEKVYKTSLSKLIMMHADTPSVQKIFSYCRDEKIKFESDDNLVNMIAEYDRADLLSHYADLLSKNAEEFIRISFLHLSTNILTNVTALPDFIDIVHANREQCLKQLILGYFVTNYNDSRTGWSEQINRFGTGIGILKNVYNDDAELQHHVLKYLRDFAHFNFRNLSDDVADDYKQAPFTEKIMPLLHYGLLKSDTVITPTKETVEQLYKKYGTEQQRAEMEQAILNYGMPTSADNKKNKNKI